MKNEGFFNEDELIFNLNDRKIVDLSLALQTMLKHLFGVLDYEKVISCTKADGFIKPDLIIKYDGIVKKISVKTGESNTLHAERINTFCTFLQNIGVSNETIETIKLFQYGDGTTDGSGKYRLNHHQAYFEYAERIKLANIELNQTPIRNEILERVMFQGVDPLAPSADAIYHGDKNNGILITKKQILEHIYKKDWSYLENLHVGPLLIAAKARYLNKMDINNKNRHYIQLYWPKMKRDCCYIYKKYSWYKSPYSK